MKPIYQNVDGSQIEGGFIPLNITIPFLQKFEHKETILDSNILSTDFLSVSWSKTNDFDENTHEFSNIDFLTIENNGSFDLTIFSKDQTQIGGQYKLKYKIN